MAMAVQRVIFLNVLIPKHISIFFSIVPDPVTERPGCYVDSECPRLMACFNRECMNPCHVISPCVPNADCIVHNTEPWRTMSCKCKEGFKGNGKVRCDKIGKNSVSHIVKYGKCPRWCFLQRLQLKLAVDLMRIVPTHKLVLIENA